MSFIKTAVLIVGLAASQLSLAALYKWVDEDGVTRYTTTPPPESARFDREVITETGRTIKKLSGEMTPEEREAEAIRLAAEEQLVKDKREADKRDRFLMASFSRVEDLVAKRDDKLKHHREQISIVESELKEADLKYKKLRTDAIFQERSGKKPSQHLIDRLSRTSNQKASALQQLKLSRNDLFETQKSFNADIERFKELRGIK